ncbi:MAG: adenylate kinase family protein [Desulfurococcales archaeon]|nr:adenylate kinase family protein [Desulfurococcales archaeon]
MEKIIIVTGTPGTGKTSVSKRLSKDLHCIYINTSELALKHGAVHKDPTGRNTTVIKEEVLIKEIRQVVNNSLGKCVVIDSHYPGILEFLKKYDPLVIVLRTIPETLIERLEERGWGRNKVLENAEAELLGIVDQEARSVFSRVYSIDTTGKSVDETLKIIYRLIEDPYRIGGKLEEPIDWLEKLDYVVLR